MWLPSSLSHTAVRVWVFLLHISLPHPSGRSWPGPATGSPSGTDTQTDNTAISITYILALPLQDSFLQDWFEDMNEYLHTGPPVYFVIKKGFNFSKDRSQDLLCSGSGCDPYSLGTQLAIASRSSNMWVWREMMKWQDFNKRIVQYMWFLVLIVCCVSLITFKSCVKTASYCRGQIKVKLPDYKSCYGSVLW